MIANMSEKLKFARSRTGLTLNQVEKHTGICKSTLSEFENGKREPKLSQLQQLAELYQRPISFFVDKQPPPSEYVLWRQKPTESPKKLEDRFLKYCMQYRLLEEWLGEVVTPKLPEVHCKPENMNFAEIQELASRVHRELGLGDRPALQLMRALEEDCGIKIFHVQFEPSGSAACTKNERFGLAILLNTKNTRWRRNFDLAHELFHLLAWDVFRPEAGCDETPSEKEEQFANVFASYLLLPDEPVRNAVERRRGNKGLSIEALFEIARQFDVSAEALVWRLHNLYNLGPERLEKTRRLVEEIRMRVPYYEQRQGDDSIPPKWPERYKALATKALRHGEISLGRFAEFLEMTRKQASEYVEQEECELEEIQLTPA